MLMRARTVHRLRPLRPPRGPVSSCLPATLRHIPSGYNMTQLKRFSSNNSNRSNKTPSQAELTKQMAQIADLRDKFAELAAVAKSDVVKEQIPTEQKQKEQNMSPLESQMLDMISMRGPLSIAAFMQQVLTDPQHGYYVRGGDKRMETNNMVNSDETVFGSRGDFTTAPEVSQMFGEMIGIWCVAMWQLLGQPKAFDLVELGPGRGTMAADIMRVARKFAPFRDAVRLSLVEVSPVLREKQRQTLSEVIGSREVDSSVQWFGSLNEFTEKSSLESAQHNLRPVIFLAQEFFDALPIHQFQHTERGWCERLIDHNPLFAAQTGNVSAPESSKYPLRLVLSPGETLAARVCLSGHPEAESFRQPVKVAYPSTGSVRLSGDGTDEHSHGPGSVDVSPQSLAIANQLAATVSQRGGAALIIDYGENGNVSESLRAIRAHKFVDLLDRPGTADLSALVDFAALKRAAKAPYASPAADEPLVPSVSVFGPVTQGHFLEALGIATRARRLLDAATDERAKEGVRQGYARLVSDDPRLGMGATYKVLAIIQETIDPADVPGNFGIPL